jgi:hypothetical protein
MSVLARIGRGCHLGIHSLLIVLRDKTLLLFPLITCTSVMATIGFFWILVGPDKLLFIFNSLRNERGVQIINWGYYDNVAFAYFMLAFVSVFFTVGLIACARITVEGQDSKFADGFKVASRNLHWVVVWAFISWTIGPVLNLLDHERHTSRLVRKVLKTTWSLLSYFVIPIMVVDKVNVFSAIRRSTTTMTNTWGKGAVSRLGLGWFFLLLNLPAIAFVIFGNLREGEWPHPFTLFVVLWVYGTVVVYQTASSVLSVVLYKYALDGTVAQGFKEAHLKAAFVKPKVYVLVDEYPEEDLAPVEAEAADNADEAPTEAELTDEGANAENSEVGTEDEPTDQSEQTDEEDQAVEVDGGVELDANETEDKEGLAEVSEPTEDSEDTLDPEEQAEGDAISKETADSGEDSLEDTDDSEDKPELS